MSTTPYRRRVLVLIQPIKMQHCKMSLVEQQIVHLEQVSETFHWLIKLYVFNEEKTIPKISIAVLLVVLMLEIEGIKLLHERGPLQCL